jgi:hypothetical protein
MPRNAPSDVPLATLCSINASFTVLGPQVEVTQKHGIGGREHRNKEF